MGNHYSFQPPPPGTVVIDIQPSAACCAEKSWHPMRKPVSAAAMPEQRWQEFSSRMGELVSQFKQDQKALFGLLFIPIGLIVLLALQPQGRGESEDRSVIWDIIHVPFMFLAVGVTLGFSMTMRSQNEQIDHKIEQLCREFSDATVTLQYMTMFTGQCKPKGAREWRALWVSPGGGGMQAMGMQSVPMGMPQMAQAVPMQSAAVTMQVTCPAESGAGDQIQINTPSGPMMVVVPAGVRAGMPFEVNVPAAVPAAVPIVSQAAVVHPLPV